MPTVTPKILPATTSATNPALMIGELLEAGVRMAGDNQIVYRDQSRHDYQRFQARVHQLAHLLTAQGVKAGDVVAVLDWDSHRYLECFFAIPMIGAVLHTVNVRLAPEQILYTMEHAEDVFVIVHEDFVTLLEPLADKLPEVRGYLLCQETAQSLETSLPLVGEFEQLLSQQPTHYDFPTFDENAVATLFYTTGTTGNPKGVFFTHRQLVLHTMAEASAFQAPGFELLNRDKVYMPITPMFHVHAWGCPTRPRCWELLRSIRAATNQTCWSNCWSAKMSIFPTVYRRCLTWWSAQTLLLQKSRSVGLESAGGRQRTKRSACA